MYRDRVNFYNNVANVFGLYITFLDDDSFLWEEGLFHKSRAKIYYKDITSVDYYNGGLISDAYFSVSTPGRTYAIKLPGRYAGLEEIAELIDKGRRRIREKENKKSVSISGAHISGADEILKYKQLLDSGIITQAEFNAKKRQILGISENEMSQNIRNKQDDQFTYSQLSKNKNVESSNDKVSEQKASYKCKVCGFTLVFNQGLNAVMCPVCRTRNMISEFEISQPVKKTLNSKENNVQKMVTSNSSELIKKKDLSDISIFRCQMCGRPQNLNKRVSVVKCIYCGTPHTVSQFDTVGQIKEEKEKHQDLSKKAFQPSEPMDKDQHLKDEEAKFRALQQAPAATKKQSEARFRTPEEIQQFYSRLLDIETTHGDSDCQYSSESTDKKKRLEEGESKFRSLQQARAAAMKKK